MTWGILIWALVVALIDHRTRRIPNVLLLPVFVMALLALATNQQSLLGASWTSALLGLLVAGLPWMVGYALGKGGAGDVKFAALLGLLTGVEVAITGTLISMLLFGGLSLVWVRAGWRGLRLPLAPLITLGFVAAYVHHTGV